MAKLSLRTAIKLEGKTADVQFERIKVVCVILEASEAYGLINFKVKPVRGEGVQNVSIDRISINCIPAYKFVQENVA